MDRLVFLPVPESYKNQHNDIGGAFSVNPDIPLPALIKNDTDESGLTNLNLDMIISGMLRVIEEKNVKQEWLDYYCAFVLFLRPDILEICQTHEHKNNS
ncbi:MAG: hypothetical protein FWD14_03975 [Treponema sp.]|nr:hypothetical protein [Treponema sp.]